MLTGAGAEDGDSALVGGAHDRGESRVAGRDAVPQRPDPGGPQHLGDPSGVVGVRMRDHEDVEAAPPRTPQPSGRGVVRPAVDEHPRARGLDQHGVALADVDRGQRQRANRRRPGEQAGDNRGDGDGRRRAGGPTAAGRQQPHHDRSRRDERPRPQRRDRAARREAMGRPQHGCKSGTGRLNHHRGQWRPQEGSDRRDAADRRGRGSGRDGEQVGRDRGEAQLTVGGEQQRGHGDLGAEGDGRQRCRGARQPAEPGAQPRGERQHTERGRGGQQQPQRSRQHRVDQDEQQHADAEKVHRDRDDPACLAGEHQDGHHPGAQDARLESREHGVCEQHDHEHPPAALRPETQQRERAGRPGQHDRDVRAADRSQVGQARGAHRVGVGGGQQTGIAGDEADREPRLGRR